MAFFGFNNKKHSSIGGDFDRDGVRNRRDCQPLNWKKQGPEHGKRKVINEIKRRKIREISPNEVALIADEIGVELKSAEVVEISDNS